AAPATTDAAFRAAADEPRQSPADLGLTGRQVDVLALMMHGKSNKAICRALDLAEPTVKNHVTAILRALKVTNRTEAVLKVGALATVGERRLRDRAAVRSHHVAAPAREQSAHAFEHHRIVIDDDDQLAAAGVVDAARGGRHRRTLRPCGGERNEDCKARTA